MQLYKARIVQVAYVIHYAGTSAQEHSFTRRAWDKTHQYWLLGWDPLVWIVGLSPIMHWLQFMNYDMWLYYTVKGGAPTDSDPGWARGYVIYLICELYIWWLIWYVICCMWFSCWASAHRYSDVQVYKRECWPPWVRRAGSVVYISDQAAVRPSVLRTVNHEMAS